MTAAGDSGPDEPGLVDILVEMVASLVGRVDAQEMLQRLAERCRHLVGADEVGISLADPDGALQIVTTTTSERRVLAVLRESQQRGPTLQAYETGESLRVALTGQQRAAGWATLAAAAGYRSLSSVAMQVEGQRVGALTTLSSRADVLSDGDAAAVHTLAQVATIVLLNEREKTRALSLADQLQRALNSRVVIEQAKGIIAEREGVGLEAAFEALRSYARRTNQRLHEVARAVVSGDQALSRRG